MLEDEFHHLLTRWSQQARLHDDEVAVILANAAGEPRGPANPAEALIAFWGQIGRMIRTQQQVAFLFMPQQPGTG